MNSSQHGTCILMWECKRKHLIYIVCEMRYWTQSVYYINSLVLSVCLSDDNSGLCIFYGRTGRPLYLAMAAIPMQFSMAEPARPPDNLDTNEAATALAIAHSLPSSCSPKVHILHSREFLLLPMLPIQSYI